MAMSKEDLCEELIGDILSRLPTKSLLRFRSVSKSVCGRISSHDFIRLHTLRSRKKKFTIILHDFTDKGIMYTMHYSEDELSSYAGITPVEYPFSGTNNNISIVGSCNGIVCLHDYKLDFIHLWNPSIRRKVALLHHQLPCHHQSYTGPGPCEFKHGFAFDPTIDDYKILRISKAGTFVYTIKTNTWREVASPDPPFAKLVSFQCLLNGALYWVAAGHKDPTFHYYDYYNYILKFDLCSEVFSAIQLPPDPCWEDRHNQVAIIKGRLAVICNNCFTRQRDSVIWVWNAAASSWSSVAIGVDVNHEPMQSAHGGDLLYSHHSMKGILLYNPETEARRVLEIMGDFYSTRIIDAITCTGSLALLDIGRSCDVLKKPSNPKRLAFLKTIKQIKGVKSS